MSYPAERREGDHQATSFTFDGRDHHRYSQRRHNIHYAHGVHEQQVGPQSRRGPYFAPMTGVSSPHGEGGYSGRYHRYYTHNYTVVPSREQQLPPPSEAPILPPPASSAPRSPGIRDSRPDPVQPRRQAGAREAGASLLHRYGEPSEAVSRHHPPLCTLPAPPQSMFLSARPSVPCPPTGDGIRQWNDPGYRDLSILPPRLSSERFYSHDHNFRLFDATREVPDDSNYEGEHNPDPPISQVEIPLYEHPHEDLSPMAMTVFPTYEEHMTESQHNASGNELSAALSNEGRGTHGHLPSSSELVAVPGDSLSSLFQGTNSRLWSS
jgi:hypothetical protein